VLSIQVTDDESEPSSVLHRQVPILVGQAEATLAIAQVNEVLGGWKLRRTANLRYFFFGDAKMGNDVDSRGVVDLDQIGQSIAVDIGNRAADTPDRVVGDIPFHQLDGDGFKGPIPLVSQKLILSKVQNKQVCQSILVPIADGNALAVPALIELCGIGNISKIGSSEVSQKDIWIIRCRDSWVRATLQDEQIGPSVAIVIDDSGTGTIALVGLHAECFRIVTVSIEDVRMELFGHVGPSKFGLDPPGLS